MKIKYIKPLLLSVAMGSLLAMSSCDNYLDVENPSTLSQEAIFSSVSYTSSAVTGIYNKLMGDDSYGSRLSTLLPNAGDDFVVAGTYNALERMAISGFGVHPGNQDVGKPFYQMYEGIERANIAIKYIPASPLYTNGTPAEQATMRKLYGEALALRALFYHELIRNWGDVPASFEPSADIPDLYLPKTNQDEVYDRLLDDLALASELVPWRSESGEPNTRITKAAVKGLRARIALARGGYALRRQSNMMERRSDYQTFYQIARNETRDIIQKSGEHSLNPSFEAVFVALNSGNADPYNEVIFEAGAFGKGNKTDSKLGYGNGIRIDQNSSYGKANGLIAAVPTYFYEFDSIADTRRDVTIAYFTIDKDDNKVLTRSTEMRDGKFRKYWTSTRDASQNLGIDWPILRYADVLLMFAEAENELNGPTAEAIEAYETVRRRAYTGNEDRMGATPTDKEGFFDAIVHERLLEFGGEGIRKYDLIRWNLLETTINDTKAKLAAFMNGEGRYANVPEDINYQATDFLNTKVSEEMAALNLYGGAGFPDSGAPLSKVMYNPEPGSVPAGYTSARWRSALDEAYIENYAVAFKANHSELFPIPTDVLNQNYNITQDYGY
ncbi:RagB/SusD family nutrient uptake outer membrane protein [Pontibacter silvestris]|uniref:RagB/SusD family nutrient uptake outer membrane protein n=1 Tax=Pontibacter silvestris TaxID=2305183 RepID=A0ABW4WTQ5_9BACT|nr:RagB/SusD family nutrient uptake outer membrane protein [Pontibacter silvestris]MCC9137244.1 RagB/SusD family nutrient uptake outer membrane protein [Pontibacter silvestris]